MNEKILIVEDSPQNLRLLAMTLRAKSYTLLTAADGEEALATAVREHPDLIIMDMQLPKKNGFEVTRRLRQIPGFSKVTIIALTAYAMKGDREKCLEAGCDTYVSKPINTREFPGVIAGLLLDRRGEKNAQENPDS
ncbi:MAG: response regulator [Dehalococcoidales bacterium]|nr:response regulator [Dehalococcoidales bacterium]